MNVKELDRGELVAVGGGILLGVSLFLSWYSLGNRNAVLGACHGPNTTCTGWAALSAVAALAVQASAETVKTFSISFAEASFDGPPRPADPRSPQPRGVP